MADKGKLWEEHFKRTWKTQFPQTFIFRLKDDVSGFKNVAQNPCDFLCLPTKKLFMIECKAHKGASIPFDAMPQYERLLDYKDLQNVNPGFLVWLYEKDIVFWCPVYVAEQIYKSGERSIGIRHFNDYDIIVLPIEKKRVNVFPDYSIMLDDKSTESISIEDEIKNIKYTEDKEVNDDR